MKPSVLAFVCAAMTFVLSLLALSAWADAVAPPVIIAAPYVRVALQPLEAWAISFIMALLTGLAALIFAYAKTHWKFMQDISMQERVVDAASRAAGIANDYLHAQANLHPTIDLKPTAIALGVQHLAMSYPEYQQKLGLDPERLAMLVVGELGKLLTPAPVLIAPAPIVVASGLPLVPTIVPPVAGAALEGAGRFVLDATKI